MSHQQRRADHRLRVLIRARMRDGARNADVCILDLSQRGLLATTATPPRRGAFVEIVLGTISLVGQVRWASEHRIGISLQDRIDVGAIAKGDWSNYRAKVAQRSASASSRSIANVEIDSGQRAKRVNLCLATMAAFAAAAFLADVVREELGSLRQVSTAMQRAGSSHQD